MLGAESYCPRQWDDTHFLYYIVTPLTVDLLWYSRHFTGALLTDYIILYYTPLIRIDGRQVWGFVPQQTVWINFICIESFFCETTTFLMSE